MIAEQEFRAGLRQQLQQPMDPDDERAGLDHLDRAVYLIVGVAAAGGRRLGQASLAPGTPTRWAAAELTGYLRGCLQDATDAGYDRGYDDGHADGIPVGEARLDALLERERQAEA